MVPSAFLSSTFAEFAEERRLLQEVVPLIDVHLICAERGGFLGLSLEETLKKWIDRSDMVILLIGMRYGSECKSGYSWTETEIRYAIDKGKRVFAYIRQIDEDVERQTDAHKTQKRKLGNFIRMLETYVNIIPKYSYDEKWRLIAMVIRDIDRYARALEQKQMEESYVDGF